MIDWKFGQTIGDPAGDLANVTLTLPTPPPGMGQISLQVATDQRAIRPMPSRNRLISTTARSVSIQMAEPTPMYTGMPYTGHYLSPAPPMYGEDQVPMTVQMPGMTTAPLGTAGMMVVDPRMSVGVHTPLLVHSSSPSGGQDMGSGETIPSSAPIWVGDGEVEAPVKRETSLDGEVYSE